MFTKSRPNTSATTVDTSKVFPLYRTAASVLVATLLASAVWYGSRQAMPEAPAPENPVAQVAPAALSLK